MRHLIDDFRTAISQRAQTASPREVLSMASRLCDDAPATSAALAGPGQFVLTPKWEILTDDIVVETQTGLQYFRDDVPGGSRPWQESMDAPSKLDVGGYRDWRPTNLAETLWMTDRKRCRPAYDTSIFRGTTDSFWWVNDNYLPLEGCAWFVYARNGYAYGRYRLYSGFVRAVRGGQS